MASRVPLKGYCATKTSRAFVFAYDLISHDAVWLRCGMVNDTVLDQDFEAMWQLPESEEDVTAFITQHGFERITTKDAEPFLRQYLTKVRMELLDFDTNKEILSDPQMSIGFVRAVKNFILDVEEL